MTRFEHLDVEAIIVEKGIRQTIDKESLDELVASIRQHGILQPIVVESGSEGRHKLLIESRRMATARIIGLEKVPVLILDGQLEAEKAITIILVENLHREDLDPIDEAEAYATLKDMDTKVSAIGASLERREPMSHTP